jgi:cell division septal protein FtsQ
MGLWMVLAMVAAVIVAIALGHLVTGIIIAIGLISTVAVVVVTGERAKDGDQPDQRVVVPTGDDKKD